MSRFKKVLLTAACAALFLMIVGSSYCQDEATEGRTVTAIHIKNNRAISSETILSKMKMKVSDKLSQAT